MRKILIVLSILIMSVPAFADVYETSANDIASRLHVIKGEIVGVNNGYVTLNRGSNNGLSKHYFVYIYRNKGSFKPFGSEESVDLTKGIAYADVTQTDKNISIAQIAEGVEQKNKYLLGIGIIPYGQKDVKGTPKIGDHWIAGKSKYRVILITRNPTIYKSLSQSLTNTNKFLVANPDEVKIYLTQERISSINSGAAIKKLARKANVDMVIKLSSTNGYNKLKYKIYNGYSGQAIYSSEQPIDKDSKDVLVAQKSLSNEIPPENIVSSNLNLSEKLTFWEGMLGKVGLYSQYSGLSMSSEHFKISTYMNIGHGATCAKVVTINSQKMVAVAEGSKIRIYNFDGNAFSKYAEFSYGYNVFHIDSAEISGKTWIALSNFNSYGALDSCIGYLDGKQFKIVKENIPYHVRFYDRFSKPVVIVQKASINKPFYGGFYKLNVDTSEITPLNLPLKVDNFYEFFRIHNNIVYLSVAKALKIYSIKTGMVTYKSPYYFAGVQQAIERYHYEPNNEESLEDVEKKNSVYIAKNLTVGEDTKGIYAIAKESYLSNHISFGHLNGNIHDAYSIKIFRYYGPELEKIYSSGNLKGNIIGMGKIGNYIVAVIGVPAGFFNRVIMGIGEIDRLSAAEIE